MSFGCSHSGDRIFVCKWLIVLVQSTLQSTQAERVGTRATPARWYFPLLISSIMMIIR